MKGIADTGFLVAFANRNDLYHSWAVSLARDVTEPLLTCEAVLAETAFQLHSVPLVFAMVTEGLVEIAFDCRSQLRACEEIADFGLNGEVGGSSAGQRARFARRLERRAGNPRLLAASGMAVTRLGREQPPPCFCL